MANEITMSGSLDFSKNDVVDSLSFSGLQIDVTGVKIARQVQEVAITEEALNLGDIGTPGYILVRNMDDTNYMEFMAGTGETETVKLKAGEWALFRFTSADPFVIADTAVVNIEYLLIED
jgi:hypothetical protein